jgi:hypothetical protein
MSFILKCDRCNKKIEKGSKYIKITYKKLIYQQTDVRYQPYSVSDCADLCPECAKIFDDWIFCAELNKEDLNSAPSLFEFLKSKKDKISRCHKNAYNKLYTCLERYLFSNGNEDKNTIDWAVNDVLRCNGLELLKIKGIGSRCVDLLYSLLKEDNYITKKDEDELMQELAAVY